MPTRNAIKEYEAEQYYHVYSRGVAKQTIFLDEQDYKMFLNLFGRYLSNEPKTSSSRVVYPWYQSRLQLLAFCLMSNHIHLLIYQNDEKAMEEFMRSLMTSYSMYFNKKYSRVGHLFQGRYLASKITQQDYLEHISRYIHLNPKKWQTYKYSSIQYYLGNISDEWIQPGPILSLFKDKQEYQAFLGDYIGYKQMLDEIKWELADQ